MEFNFNVVLDTEYCQRLVEEVKTRRLFSDVCCFKSMNDLERVLQDEDRFLQVVQKSDLWLHLRATAAGTASSLGKLLKSPCQYPTWYQVGQAWKDKLNKVPFDSKGATAAHMKWGNVYEDIAQFHFSVENEVSVAQVGTIRLPMAFVSKLCGFKTSDEMGREFFLVSPDGLVGAKKPENDATLPQELKGMLEIKCISPFHHCARSEDGKLMWCEDMERRQWSKAHQIPFGYIAQICMQALAGMYRFSEELSEDSTMWFIRWSPLGFSEFSVPFKELLPLGGVLCLLYLTVKKRVEEHGLTSNSFDYETEEELQLFDSMCQKYETLVRSMAYRYVSHDKAYPEFYAYQEATLNEPFNAV